MRLPASLVMSLATLAATLTLATAQNTLCSDSTDIVLVIDSSESIDTESFSQIRNATATFAEQAFRRIRNLRIGAVIYDREATPFLQLSADQGFVISTLLNVQKTLLGSTYTHEGISAGAALFNSQLNRRVMIVITDGLSNDETATKTAADNAKASGITIFSVGVTANVISDFLRGRYRQEVRNIATSINTTATVESFNTLAQSIGGLLENVCVTSLAYVTFLQDVTEVVGQTVTLRATMNELASSGAVWYKDGSGQISADGRVNISASGTEYLLTINNVQISDAGTYTLNVGGVTTSATVTVTPGTGWTEWNQPFVQPCSATCGGVQQRTYTRRCVGPSSSCPGLNIKTEFEPCSDPCSAGDWSAWTVFSDTCSVSCGVGTRRVIQTRTCPSGSNCLGSNTNVTTSPCILAACPDGEWSAWTVFSDTCSVSCGVGTREVIQTRTCPSGNTCPGSNSNVTTSTCTLAACPVCGTDLDVYLAIDGSNSIGKDSYKDIYLPAIANFVVDLLQTNPDRRVGYVVYSSNINSTATLTNNFNSLSTNITNEPYPDAGTATDLALLRINDLFNQQLRQATKVAIVITDGSSNNRTLTLQAAQTLKNNNVTILVVGVGRRVNRDENRELASSPDKAIEAANIADLAEILTNLTSQCPATWNPWGPWNEACSATCGGLVSGQRQRFRTCVDQNNVASTECVGSAQQNENVCIKPDCPAVWGAWVVTFRGPCNQPCNGGNQTVTRTRTCQSGNCVGTTSSTITEECNTNACTLLNGLVNIRIPVGTDFQLNATLVELGVPGAVWTKDGIVTTSNFRFTSSVDGNRQILRVTNAQLGDSGMYVLRVGGVTTTAIVTVFEEAVWGAWVVTFRGPCNQPCNGGNQTVTRTRTCQSGNCVGTTSSTITEECNTNACTLLNGLVNIRIPVGTDFQLNATLAELGVPGAVWTKDGIVTTSNFRFTSSVDGNRQILRVTNAQLGDSGMYVLRVGGVTTTAIVTVFEEAVWGAWVVTFRGPCNQPCNGGNQTVTRTRTCQSGNCVGTTSSTITEECNTNACTLLNGLVNIRIPVGTDFQLNATLAELGVPGAVWTKDGIVTTSNFRFTSSVDGNRQILRVTNAQLGDSGMYVLRVGGVTTTAIVTVFEEAVWGAWVVTFRGPCNQPCNGGNQTVTRTRTCQSGNCVGTTSSTITEECNTNACTLLNGLVNIRIPVGTDFQLNATLAELSVPGAVWTKDGIVTTSNFRFTSSVDGNRQILRVTNAQLGDSGMYALRVGGVTTTAIVTVFEEVQWSSWRTLTEGNCSVTCGQGFRRGTRNRTCISGNCQGNSVEDFTSICVLTPCPAVWGAWVEISRGTCNQPCNGGSQTVTRTRVCQAGNCVGATTSTITEECNTNPCTLTARLLDVRIPVGTSFTLNGALAEQGVTGAVWMVNGTVVNLFDPRFSTLTTDNTHILSVANAQLSDSGVYTLIVGGVTTTANVIVFEIPGWSQWSSTNTVGACSLTCGGGFRWRTYTRTCNTTTTPCGGSNVKNETETCNTQSCQVCATDLDVYLAIDGSNSVGKDSFRDIYLPAIANFAVDLLQTNPDRRVGYVVYSTYVNSTVTLTNDFNFLNTSIRNETYPDAGTETHLALQRINDLFSTVSRTSSKIAVVITDGSSSQPNLTQQAGTTLKTNSITVMTVGIGRRVRVDELTNLASPGLFTTADNFADLSNILSSLTNDCPVAVWSPWVLTTVGNCDRTCGGGTRQRTFVRTCNITGTLSCPGSNTKTEPEACNVESCPVCATDLDVYLAIDGSNSVGKDSFRDIYLPAIANFAVDLLQTNPDRRVGYVVYSTYVNSTVTLTNDFNFLNTSIRNETYPDAGTETHLALQRINDLFSTVSRTSSKIAVVITDGSSSQPNLTQQAGTTLKTNSITVMTVGIGRRVRVDELTNLASPGLFTTADNFADLSNILSSLTNDCPVAVWSPWVLTSVGNCDRTCGGGTRQRTFVRTCNSTATLSCPGNNIKTESEACNVDACPATFGTWRQWGQWTPGCPDCGDNPLITQVRTRICDRLPNQLQCPGNSQDSRDFTCTIPLCPVGTWNQWSSWSPACPTPCSTTPLTRSQSRNRQCFKNLPTDRDCQGLPTEVRTIPCTVCPATFGTWQQWGQWTPGCPDCGDNPQIAQVRTRICDRLPNQLQCSGNSQDSRVFTCTIPLCPVGTWNQWSSWSPACPTPCSTTPLTRSQSRIRQCFKNLPTDRDCQGLPTEARTIPCTVCQDGLWQQWGPWSTNCPSSCSATFLQVTDTRTRQCNLGSGGIDCIGVSDETKVTTCDRCPAVWQNWGSWSQPNCPSCGLNQIRPVNRNRICNPNPGEPFCVGSSTETEDRVCNIANCIGVWGQWTQWSLPSCPSCGVNVQRDISRTRICVKANPTDNDCVGNDVETNTVVCNIQSCDVGVWNAWSEWSPVCPACGLNVRRDQVRSRTCSRPNFARPCVGSPTESRSHLCIIPQCPDDPGTLGLCANVRNISGVGYRYHPYDCDKYIQCYFNPNGAVTAVYRVCPYGHYWSQKLLRCAHSWKVDCPFERCNDSCTTTYNMEGSGRAYWSCEHGKSVAECCPSGMRYVSGKGCLVDFYSRDPCPTPCSSTDACDKAPVWNNPEHYNFNVGLLGWMEGSCLPGSRFDILECGCTFRKENTCTSEFSLDFKNQNAITTAAGNWLKLDSVTTDNGVATFTGVGEMTADVRLSEAGFSCPFVLRFRYLQTGQRFGRQVLASSNDCHHGSTMVISLHNNTVLFELKNWYGTLLSMPLSSSELDPESWQDVTLVYNGKQMTGILRQGKYTVLGQLFAPKVMLGECGLRFGSDGSVLTAFEGQLDNINLYKCDPGDLY